MHRQLLITATDTGVGKTITTLCLAAYWQRYYPEQPLALFKMVQCGPGDMETYGQVLPEVTKVCGQSFDAPLAPPLAAAQEGRRVDLGEIWQKFQEVQTTHRLTLMEGPGGLGCPMTLETPLGKLVQEWHLPFVLVAPVRLGVLGHLAIYSHHCRSLSLDLKGIILCCPEPNASPDWAPKKVIENLCLTPVLGTIPYLQDFSPETLSKAASDLDLERLGW